MSYLPLSIDGVGHSTARSGPTRPGRIAPVQAVAPAAAPPGDDARGSAEQERRGATERRQRQSPVLLDTRCSGERRGRLRPLSC